MPPVAARVIVALPVCTPPRASGSGLIVAAVISSGPLSLIRVRVAAVDSALAFVAVTRSV